MSFILETIKKKIPKLIRDEHILEQEFDKKYSIDKRINEVDRLHLKYPDRIPVIITAIDNKQPVIKKNKFLVPDDLSVGQFIYVIKKYILTNKEEAIFIFTKINTLVPSTWTMSQLYNEYKSNDKFLYLFYSIENTFG